MRERKIVGVEQRPVADIEPISFEKITIDGVVCTRRTIFADPRGALLETFSGADADPSVYAYFSVTNEGYARDEKEYHQHFEQEDRFTVIFGTMLLLLCDMREGSPTYGKLEMVEMRGMDLNALGIADKKQTPSATITVPIGVLHAIKAPGPGAAVIVNHPTQKYSGNSDEGRVPFSSVDIPGIGFFDWDRVRK